MPSLADIERSYYLSQLGLSTSSLTNADLQTQFFSQASVNVKTFGVVGNGTVDDTVNIQKAIDAVLTYSGGRLYFPNGIYKLTAPLVIPASAGWSMYGASRFGVTLKQFTDNVPVISFANTLTHSFWLDSLSFSYNNLQPVTNTNAVALFFTRSDGAGGTANIFNYAVTNCRFSRGYRGMSSDTTKQVAMWGGYCDFLTFEGNMSGSAIRLVPTPAVGQPNNSLNNIYIDAASCQETAIRADSCDTLSLKNVEINNFNISNTSGPEISISSVNQLSMVSCKSEVFVGSRATGGAVWDFPNTNATLIACTIGGTFTSTGQIWNLVQANTSGSLSLIGFSGLLDASSATNTVRCASASSARLFSNVTIPSGTASRYGTGTSPTLDVDLAQPNTIQTVGDTNTVLTATSPPTTYYNTTLTNNRTVTLPSSNVIAGMTFTVTRYGLGAFTLQIIDPLSGKNITIAASTRGSVTYKASSSGEWVPTALSTFP